MKKNKTCILVIILIIFGVGGYFFSRKTHTSLEDLVKETPEIYTVKFVNLGKYIKENYTNKYSCLSKQKNTDGICLPFPKKDEYLRNEINILNIEKIRIRSGIIVFFGYGNNTGVIIYTDKKEDLLVKLWVRKLEKRINEKLGFYKK